MPPAAPSAAAVSRRRPAVASSRRRRPSPRLPPPNLEQPPPLAAPPAAQSRTGQRINVVTDAISQCNASSVKLLIDVWVHQLTRISDPANFALLTHTMLHEARSASALAAAYTKREGSARRYFELLLRRFYV